MTTKADSLLVGGRGFAVQLLSIALTLTCACNLNSALPGNADAPATPDTTATPDGGLGLWGPPRLITAAANPAFESNPSVRGDLLELYFNSNRGANHDVYVSKRTSVTEEWGPPEAVVEINAASPAIADLCPQISSNGLTLWFASDRVTLDSHDIYVSTRATTSSPWSAPEAVPELNTAQRDLPISVTASGLTLVVLSDRPGGPGDLDLYLATRPNEASTWTSISAATELNTSEEEAGDLTDDGSRFYLMTLRNGNFDLVVAERGQNGMFETTFAIDELNTESSERHAWVSADERYMVFSSDRSGNSELYETSR